MKLISKLKKISVCSLLSAGTLIPLANVGLSAMYPSRNMSNVSEITDEDITMDIEEDVPSSNSAPTSQQHSTSEQQPKPAFTFGYSSEPLPESFTFGKSSKPEPAFKFADPMDIFNSFFGGRKSDRTTDTEYFKYVSDGQKADLINQYFSLICGDDSPESAMRKLGLSKDFVRALMKDEYSRVKNMSQEEKRILLNQLRSLLNKGESEESASIKLGISLSKIKILRDKEIESKMRWLLRLGGH